MKLSDNFLNIEAMFGEPVYEKVTINKWARNRRQKIIQNISFESEIHNIYNPVYTSDQEDSLDSIYKIDDNIEIKVTHRSSDSNSDLSVAEERDTIDLSQNAITPNLSRVLNNCSISKME